MIPPDPRLQIWIELAGLLADVATVTVVAARRALRPPSPPPPRHPGRYRTRRPGPKSPHWNRCRELLRYELRPYGSKVRLARYLGVPKQRITDFVAGRRRMPDAEILLRILHWIAVKRAGRDLSL